MGDISNYNAQRNVSPVVHFDFDAYQEMGGKIITIRGGVNAAGEDWELDYNLNECNSRGLHFRVYHAVKLWKNLDTQAKIIEGVINQAKSSPYYVESDFDIETNDGLNKQEMVNAYQKLDNKVLDRVGEALGVYTRAYWWNANVARSDRPKQRRLWIAHHFTGIDPFRIPSVRPYIPDDWGAINNPVLPTWWQIDTYDNGWAYGSRGDDEIDMNIFTLDGGTSQAFENHYGFAITPEPPPPIPPPPPPPPGNGYAVTVTASTWNVRSGPGTQYADVGDLHAGDLLQVEGNVYGRDAWVKIISGPYAGNYFAMSWANSAGTIVRSAEPV